MASDTPNLSNVFSDFLKSADTSTGPAGIICWNNLHWSLELAQPGMFILWLVAMAAAACVPQRDVLSWRFTLRGAGLFAFTSLFLVGVVFWADDWPKDSCLVSAVAQLSQLEHSTPDTQAFATLGKSLPGIAQKATDHVMKVAERVDEYVELYIFGLGLLIAVLSFSVTRAAPRLDPRAFTTLTPGLSRALYCCAMSAIASTGLAALMLNVILRIHMVQLVTMSRGLPLGFLIIQPYIQALFWLFVMTACGVFFTLMLAMLLPVKEGK